VTNIWFNQGYSGVRDAVQMIGEAGAGRACLLASHSDPHAPVFDVADVGFLEPKSKAGDDYVAFCLDTCKAREVDLFVPQGSRKLIAAHVADFEAIGTRVALAADAEMLSLIDDKARFYEMAVAANIPMPWTREIDGVAGYDAALADLAAMGKRACVKPPQGVFGGGFWHLVPERSLFATLMDTEAHMVSPTAMRGAIADYPNPLRLLVLEFLPGDEWSLDCVAKDGRLIVGVGRRKMGRAQRLEVDGPIFDIARDTIANFGLSGLINVQCRAGESEDDIRLLEVNSRMSGGCLYTRYSGVNLPWVHVALELGWITEADIPVPIGGGFVGPSTEARLVTRAPAPAPEPVDA
jgi:ATP-grasp in the biosynthetic pathway with Ter operon